METLGWNEIRMTIGNKEIQSEGERDRELEGENRERERGMEK